LRLCPDDGQSVSQEVETKSQVQAALDQLIRMVSPRRFNARCSQMQQIETDGSWKRSASELGREVQSYVADHNLRMSFKEVIVKHDNITDIYTYMRTHASLLGERILQEYPALHQFDDPVSPRIEGLLRKPFPAQTIAIMGLVKRWQEARTGMVVAECGTGKTLISLGAIHVHSKGGSFTSLAMVPPHLVEKWAREAFLTLPGVRVFLIDDLRNGGDENKSHGVNEVRLRRGHILREGFQTSLSELRLRSSSSSPRERWSSLCGRPSLFIVGRERAKLGYFWRHAYRVPRSGSYLGCVVNSDTGKPVFVDDSR